MGYRPVFVYLRNNLRRSLDNRDFPFFYYLFPLTPTLSHDIP